MNAIEKMVVSTNDGRAFHLLDYFPKTLCLVICAYAEDDTSILSKFIKKRGGVLTLPSVVYHMNGLGYSNDWIITKDASGQINFDYDSLGRRYAYLESGEWISEMHILIRHGREIPHLIEQLRALMKMSA